MSKLGAYIPAIIVMSIIFAVSATPGEAINSAGLGYEPLHVNGHFFLFFLLCFCYYRATHNILMSVVLTVLYGVVDELHQLYTPLRSPSIRDVSVDTLGALLAGIILWKLLHILPKTLKAWLRA